MARKITCLICDNKAQTRDVCHTHRDECRAIIDAGAATDAELVEAGLMGAKKPLGRPKKAKRRTRKESPSLDGNLVWQKFQELHVTEGAKR